MSFKNEALVLLLSIKTELQATRHAILHQTKMLLENPTSANKETNKPKEAAPAPKAITWQEAVKALRDLCKIQRYCGDCPAKIWCDKALPPNMSTISPNGWEVPGDE